MKSASRLATGPYPNRTIGLDIDPARVLNSERDTRRDQGISYAAQTSGSMCMIPTPSCLPWSDRMTAFDPRQALSRTIAVANGKGGVGKTSTTTHVAGMLARQGHRVLVVDLDPQGNVAQDLGYTCPGCPRCMGAAGSSDVELCDFGYGLSQAVQFGGQPGVIKDVGGRTNLDVVPGGGALEELAAVLAARRNHSVVGQPDAMLAFAGALAPLAAGYDLVLIDCPPGHRELQESALGAARYLLIPVKTDQSSTIGLRLVATRFGDARLINPTLELLGVLMFGVTAAAKNVRKEAKEWVDATLGGDRYVFKATVRHVEMPAGRIRALGQLAHELETGAEGVTASAGKSMVGLAGDYEAVTAEMLSRLIAAEQREQELLAQEQEEGAAAHG